MMEKLIQFVRDNPIRTRAFVLALLVLIASVVPGLPVDLIDAAVVAGLALAATEGERKVRKVRQKRQDAV